MPQVGPQLGRFVGALVVALVVATLNPAVAGAQGTPAQALPRAASGEDAIRLLGQRLAGVAREHGMTAAELRATLRHDDTLWVDPTAALYYVEPAAAETVDTTTGAALDGPFDLAQTFQLHSNPGADRVVYLDFDGHEVRRTAWNSGPDRNGYYAAAASVDTDEAFTDDELARIQSVWQHVAEDFAPFDVDVTTEDPGADAITRSGSADALYGTRVLITSTTATECTCGGVAYVGVFNRATDHAYYQPAFVYTRHLSGFHVKNVAEAATHEAGHNLGLSHDGGTDTGYYGGHGDWAPIMGVGYARAITQWSAGEYAGATNTEDDLARMTAYGAPLRDDDHGLRPQATPLGAGPSVMAQGVIGTRADVDAFTFVVPEGGGVVSLTVRPSATSPDLDIRAELVGPDGSPVLASDPLSSSSGGLAAGLDASLTTALTTPGTYTVTVDGVGKGDPLVDGYSDYASLGHYVISGTVPGDGSTTTPEEPDPTPEEPATDPQPDPQPPAAPDVVTATPEGTTVLVAWGDVAGEDGFEVVRETWHRNGSWRATSLGTVAADTLALPDSPGDGTHRYQVRAMNEVGASAWVTSPEVIIGGGGGGKPNGKGAGG